MIAVMECPLCHAVPAGLFHERLDKRYGARTYYRCATCRLIFLLPGQRLAPADEKARYDTHENKPDDPGYLGFLRRLADPVLERVRPNSEGLDYGSGPGPAMQAIFAEHGHSVANYDPFYAPDPSVLEREYDFVTCSETIEHFYRPDDEFQRMARLLYRTEAVLGAMRRSSSSRMTSPTGGITSTRRTCASTSGLRSSGSRRGSGSKLISRSGMS